METGRKAWMAAGAGAVLLVLSFSVFWGGESAAGTLPGKRETVPSREEMRGESAPEAARRYDSARYVRRGPLQDPFYASPPEPSGTAKMQQAGPLPVRGMEKQEKTAAEEPVLQGILFAGERSRAIIRTGGAVYTAGEGEEVGRWRVLEIRERQAVLAGGGERRVLSL